MTGFMLYQKLNGKWRDDKMSDKYGVPVIPVNCLELNEISEYRIDTGGKGGISFRGTESG